MWTICTGTGVHSCHEEMQLLLSSADVVCGQCLQLYETHNPTSTQTSCTNLLAGCEGDRSMQGLLFFQSSHFCHRLQHYQDQVHNWSPLQIIAYRQFFTLLSVAIRKPQTHFCLRAN